MSNANENPVRSADTNPYAGMLACSVERDGSWWVGVLRDRRRKTVATCGHRHTNRDRSTTFRLSARDCIRRQYAEMCGRSAFAEQTALEARMYRTVEQ